VGKRLDDNIFTEREQLETAQVGTFILGREKYFYRHDWQRAYLWYFLPNLHMGFHMLSIS